MGRVTRNNWPATTSDIWLLSLVKSGHSLACNAIDLRHVIQSAVLAPVFGAVRFNIFGFLVRSPRLGGDWALKFGGDVGAPQPLNVHASVQQVHLHWILDLLRLSDSPAQPTSWGVNRPKRNRIGPELSGLRHFNEISSSGSRADRAAVDMTAGTASNPAGWRHSEAGHWTVYPSSTFVATRLWRFRMKSQEKRSEARSKSRASE
ncbi:uncharacterized protein BDZ83DRAFT_646380 [Colletotrichum acutatum]|uniref:Uncharacterized protein n=1 Tax=Glomerella acutata TaxID=27357 RepID=A0AAD8XPA0_GLOAC|nr:uncharacterized protein BDZ83DRAFT_646380 [Colletotrichum acutatum]KAK1730938.1 hypothetical protein BDZ83DRAFT_646380 [Colletotrichum acutatum]